MDEGGGGGGKGGGGHLVYAGQFGPGAAWAPESLDVRPLPVPGAWRRW